jgi:hypothetical protein
MSCSAECTTPPGLGALPGILLAAREVRVEERQQELRGDPTAELNH